MTRLGMTAVSVAIAEKGTAAASSPAIPKPTVVRSGLDITAYRMLCETTEAISSAALMTLEFIS